MSTDEEKKSNEQYSKNFTRIPNVLFVAYPDVTKEEKYLYADLRRVYWDMKPRFVSLRELSNATKYSISALSKMLPRLNEAGLIHAEIRREKAKNGREKGNPKYHITIVDIWEVNRMFFSCSQNEQVELANVPSAQLVHEIEQACSRNNTSLFTKTNNPDMFREQDRAQVERAKDNNKDTSKDLLKEESITDQSQTTNSSPHGDTLLQEMMKRLEAMEKRTNLLEAENQSLKAKLSTPAKELPTNNTQGQANKQTRARANKQASCSQQTTQPALLSDEKCQASQSEGKKTEQTKEPPKETKPRQPLTEPDESMEWGVEKAMAWANFFRGFAWPVKNHPNSKHKRALESAELIIQRGIPEKKFVFVFRYMKGLLSNKDFHSNYWYGKEVDIWTVNDHYEDQKNEINDKRAKKQQNTNGGEKLTLEQAINPDRVIGGLTFFPNVFSSNTLVTAGGK